MLITIRVLKLHNACLEGIEAFRAVFPKGTRWTREDQLTAFRSPKLARYVMWGVRQGIIPLWSMSRANLTGAYLAGADLAGADLAGAYLARANLAGAYLAGAYRPKDAPPGWEVDASGRLVRAGGAGA